MICGTMWGAEGGRGEEETATMLAVDFTVSKVCKGMQGMKR